MIGKPNLTERAIVTNRYNPALDGLRAVAVLAVVLLHLSYRRFPGGRLGVDIFFVLSGYLITTLLAQERDANGRIAMPAFYMRRILRLMPALVLMLTCESVFFAIFGGPSPYEFGDVVAALTYVTDFRVSLATTSWVSTVMHTWSLAVEEHFYILWPFLLVLVLRVRAQLQAPVIVSMWAMLVLWRSYLVFHGAPEHRTEFAFDTRMDPMLLGGALALWLRNQPSSEWIQFLRKLAPFAALALGVLLLRDENSALWMRSFGWAGAAVLIALVLLGLIAAPTGIFARALSVTPIAYIGKISYGVYLWHWPLLIHLRYREVSETSALICVAGAVVVAAASYHFVELPFLRLKKRFERRPGREDLGPVQLAMPVSTTTLAPEGNIRHASEAA